LPSDEESILLGCDAIVTKLNATDGTLQPYKWLRSIDDSSSNEIAALMAAERTSDTSHHPTANPPEEALAAIEATHRWAANFVRPLHLCPWAGSSLDTRGAIRYWVLLSDASNDRSSANNDDVFGAMTSLIRAAGVQLEQITSEPKAIDASVAISFVILVPTNVQSDFEPFHDFFLDLEDSLLDECDEYWENDGEHHDESTIPDACKITIAAFHPKWKFNNQNDGNEIASAIDYEKRTPYPTVSIVMSSAIDALMERDVDSKDEENSSSIVTNRIAATNEKTLCKLGVDKLSEMFEKEVLCPMRFNKGE
jgi:hypothetical protein